MFNTQGGIYIGEEFITDLNSVVDKFAQKTSPWVFTFPDYKKDKFNPRKWSNKDLLEFALDSISGECQERCAGFCHCSEIRQLMKRRFKNV